MKPRWTTLLVLAIAVATVVAGCGSSSPKAGSTSSAPTSSAAAGSTSSAAVTSAPAATAGGACAYVTTAEASALATSPVKAGVGRSLATGPVTFDYCDYIFDPGNAPGVSVAVANLGAGGTTLFAQFKESKADESEHQDVSGVGDEAFFSGQNLYVRKGDKGLILYVGRISSSPRGVDGLDDEKRLAALILDKL